MKRHVIGCMTGTSCDGLDIALVTCEGPLDAPQARCLDFRAFELGSLGQRLRAYSEGQALCAADLCQLNHDFSLFHVEALRSFGMERCELIAIHGQTVYHAPPLSWQMIDLSLIASRLERPVIGDLRGADLARGGQGAPITPLADWVFYRSTEESRAVVNMGGFCNVTHLPRNAAASELKGYDLCAANQLLDRLAQRWLDRAFDPDGRAALSGQAQGERVDFWLNWLRNQRQEGQSLGQQHWPREEQLDTKHSAEDELASANRALARCLCENLQRLDLQRILCAGGGWKNRALLNNVIQLSPVPVEDSGDHGPSAEAREAAAMALLGALAWEKRPITLPQVTGAKGSFCSGLKIEPQ